jgi:hypothetical protein
MATPSFHPALFTDAELAEDLAAEAQVTNQSFDKIVAGMAAPKRAAQKPAKPKKSYITVRVTMPHVKQYGKPPVMSLTYGCSFVVVVGDQVLCPPTRLNPKWTRGTVTDLKDNGYHGPVKYVAPLGGRGGKR